MKKALLFIALAIFGLACGGSKTKQVNIEDGKEVYKKYCVACHGENGEKALNGAVKFPESKLSAKERVLVITNGRNMMTPFKGILSEDEIKAVADYTVILSKKD
jgi:mono/diheme cytochrome c family protein